MSKKKKLNLPTKEQILEVLANDKTIKSRRDLGRAFGIKGEMRTPFKLLLRGMSKQGLIGKISKNQSSSNILPSVSVLEIPKQANPEELYAYPLQWRGQEAEKPKIFLNFSKNTRVSPAAGDRILAKIKYENGQYSASPMKVLDKPRTNQIGIISLDDNGARLIPIDRKQKEMRISAADLNSAKNGDLVEVEVKITGRMMIPMAKVTNVVGNPQSEGAISLIALHNLEIPYIFPNSVIKQADEIIEITFDKAKEKKREDWLDIDFITIDPITAKDHDDAVFAKKDDDPNNNGGYLIYIAIADVAAYIKPNSALDKEAYLRGNSVYFPDKVVPMLPKRISNNLCSLIEGKNRPSMALKMQIDENGNIISHEFHRIMMRSRAKLSYQQAQNAIDGLSDEITEPLLESVIKPLYAAYDCMKKARQKRAPLDLDLPEKKIVLDENGIVKAVHTPERLEAHRLIEEMMIAANVCAATSLEQNKTALLYRVHDVPGREKLIALREFLASLKMSFSKSDSISPKDFNRTLKLAKKNNKSEQVNEMVLRSQAQAEYSPINYGHFGLNLDRYAHFTSPIRRYSDLIVHRALISVLKTGSVKQGEQHDLVIAGQHLSNTERRAMAAERETNDRLIAQFMSEKINSHFMGRIAGIVKSGLFVRLVDSGADGFVPASTLGSDYFRYIEDEQAMIGERTGEKFQLGDNVEVKLLEVAPMAGALRFEIISDGEFVAPLSKNRSRGRNNNSKRNHQRSRRKHT